MDAGPYEPWIPDFDDNSRWRWEWWKVGLQPEALFTTLEAQHNTVPYRIQDDEAFHHDVSDAAHEAKNVDDFHARLARRRDERLQELRKAWTRVSLGLLYSKTMLDEPPTRWGAFQHFTSNRSLDSIVNFFPLAPPIRNTDRFPATRRTAPTLAACRGRPHRGTAPGHGPGQPVPPSQPAAEEPTRRGPKGAATVPTTTAATMSYYATFILANTADKAR